MKEKGRLNELDTKTATAEEVAEWRKTWDGVSPAPGPIHRYIMDDCDRQQQECRQLIDNLISGKL